jgi:membrane-bound lytic murein transglycosylase C
MFKKLLLTALLVNASSATTFEEYKKSQEQDFSKEKIEFQTYKREQENAFQNYKKELEKYWNKPVVNSKKELVSYSTDKKSRSLINFKKNQLTIQTVAKDKEEAKRNLALALAQAVTFDSKDFYTHDQLEKELVKIDESHNIPPSKIDSKPVLAPLFFKKQPTKKRLFQFVKKEIKPKKISIRKSPKLTNAKVYTIKIELPKNATVKRSYIYYKQVAKSANKEHLPLSLIFAIMHSESSFNPMARSHIPAYGLMQIVPRTAGIDSYYYLYKQKRLVGSSFLYNSTNNIKMGSAYLHILYYSYLREINDPLSRLYCTIAAYNTGAGNVARAFVHVSNTHKAARVINRLSPNEVYKKLLRDLPYDEPKRYLINVTKRISIYKKVYKRS